MDEVQGISELSSDSSDPDNGVRNVDRLESGLEMFHRLSDTHHFSSHPKKTSSVLVPACPEGTKIPATHTFSTAPMQT